ncbi:MAG TPA: A/G-specific adenine glycosylase, partial [Chloroflexota bacterium]|nr:A/G-specific adenine glycosylase [Chloroflexota bacterium]
WMARYPTLSALAAAPRADVIRAWAGLGYNLRAVRLHEIARQAVERYGGQLPATPEDLLSLKGIGRYTAGAVMCFAHNAPEPVLDTNVRRVLGRIFAAEAPQAIDDDRVAWPLAAAALPDAADVYDWNQALMDVGATICLSRAPRCLLCPAQDSCTARREWFAPSGVTSAVAETPVAYATRRPKQGKFEGSRRWYRGRIVDALREASAGVALSDLAARIDLDPVHASEVVEGLVRDGLVEFERGVARLPS